MSSNLSFLSPSTGYTLLLARYDPSASWFEVGGLYAFAQPLSGNWFVRYVGKTENFRQRFASHEHWPNASRLGCTSIFATRIDNDAVRTLLERELIEQWQPTLNTQLKPQHETSKAGLNGHGLLGDLLQPRPARGLGSSAGAEAVQASLRLLGGLSKQR